ncbi:MAG: RAMP superfamily protein [Microcoleus sp. SM1_3_4]|nr:RAMP superfamily protein [Microcoleus sp. SM1_3_4]
MYAGNQLIQLLQKQHEARGNSGLFQTGIFTVLWRAKVGSFPHPDGETIVSAGEPCGAWRPSHGRPEDKRNVGENLKQLSALPLNGYIPGSAIRGLVRSWAKERPEIQLRMRELLGYQDSDTISAGKIEFLDAWPKEPTKLTLDIVNPQERFQVYHDEKKQSTPLSFYAFGDGESSIELTVAIRGIPGKANAAEVAEVWGWVQQALTLYGVGSRTASGYGAIASPDVPKPNRDPNYPVKTFNFSLYSQGCYGADTQEPELRPSHWRGWLRSWVLRFLLGVMSEENAKTTLGELFGVLEPDSCKGCVRSQMIKGEIWGERSANQPYFYTWKGKLQVTAPKDILNKIILPIIRFAVMVGGLGRGWRRPLHIFVMNNGRDAARGTYLTLTHLVKNPDTNRLQNKAYGLPLNESNWTKTYQDWLNAVQLQWPNRFSPGQNPKAEVFSPTSCAVYILPDPQEEPVDKECQEWSITKPLNTRGCGMNLIYQPKYKRKSDVGGDAGSGNAHCSWASIKRVNIPNKIADCECQEVVCMFAGGIAPNSRHLRADFLRDLGKITDAVHLFGLEPSP